jgi:hypothetical protein
MPFCEAFCEKEEEDPVGFMLICDKLESNKDLPTLPDFFADGTTEKNAILEEFNKFCDS